MPVDNKCTFLHKNLSQVILIIDVSSAKNKNKNKQNPPPTYKLFTLIYLVWFRKKISINLFWNFEHSSVNNPEVFFFEKLRDVCRFPGYLSAYTWKHKSFYYQFHNIECFGVYEHGCRIKVYKSVRISSITMHIRI